MRLRPVVALVLGALVLGVLGCTGSSTSGPSSSLPPPGPPVELKLVSAAEWDKVVESHKGKVIVVDVWAMWCEPCKKKFPSFVELSQKYPPGEVVFLSLTVDEADNHDAALKKLTEWSANMPNYRYEDTAPWAKALKLDNLPACWVYGRDGKLGKTFVNPVGGKEFTYTEVEAEVKTQLARK